MCRVSQLRRTACNDATLFMMAVCFVNGARELGYLLIIAYKANIHFCCTSNSSSVIIDVCLCVMSVHVWVFISGSPTGQVHHVFLLELCDWFRI
jgi:hypothetical protein